MSERHFSVKVENATRCIVAIQDYPIYENHITFLFGESGIGKSIISKALYGLLDTSALRITINGRPYGTHLYNEWTKSVRDNSFFVFQEPSSHLNPLLKIDEQLNEGSLDYRGASDILEYLWQHSNDQALKTILDIYPKPYRPSGGEKQRILLAMAFKKINALIENGSPDAPTCFVFDEPTGSLDNKYRNLFINLLFQKYYHRNFSAVIITHDYSIISEIYQNYKQFIPKIHFKELSRINDSLVKVDDFSAQDYIHWLNNSQWTTPSKISAQPVLEFEPEFSIFSRKLCIYKDSQHTVKSPLIINKGTCAYLKAPSGIGKTTLAKIVMGIYKADRFSMNLGGKRYSENSHESMWLKEIWGKKAGMVFQHADESLNLEATIKETFKGLRHISSDDIVPLLNQLFDNSINDSFLDKKVALLSGGQKQRLNLLRTLALDPELLIFDEPLNGLDFDNVKKVLSLLDNLRLKGTALLMISHNEEIFETLIDRNNIFYLSEM
jgi:ABC-type dipeptide/oligopeptide/nickel transport system ATPase subunit